MSFIGTAALGWLVSFLGQLPLGNTSITATQIGVGESVKNAWLFSIGVAIVEVIYLRIALSGMNWVVSHETFFNVLNWVAIALFLGLGIITIVAANKKKEQKKALLLNNTLNRFVLGLSMSAVNPIQIPFWFTWSVALIKSGGLTPENAYYNAFTIGAGVGTISGLAVYIYAGKWLIQKLNASQSAVNKFMGGVFIFTALIQLYKVVISPLIKGK